MLSQSENPTISPLSARATTLTTRRPNQSQAAKEGSCNHQTPKASKNRFPPNPPQKGKHWRSLAVQFQSSVSLRQIRAIRLRWLRNLAKRKVKSVSKVQVRTLTSTKNTTPQQLRSDLIKSSLLHLRHPGNDHLLWKLLETPKSTVLNKLLSQTRMVKKLLNCSSSKLPKWSVGTKTLPPQSNSVKLYKNHLAKPSTHSMSKISKCSVQVNQTPSNSKSATFLTLIFVWGNSTKIKWDRNLATSSSAQSWWVSSTPRTIEWSLTVKFQWFLSCPSQLLRGIQSV